MIEDNMGGAEEIREDVFRGNSNNNVIKQKVGQEQIHGLLFGEQLSWRAIIYDLINTEQLDPWDVDLSLLVNKYLEKIKELEEANFFVSSKVLLAAALLLRVKSEILLNYHLSSLDEILFGKKEESRKYVQERIELDDDVPGLIVRTPLPRFKKVSLEELMQALGKAIQTENRRIGKIVLARQMEYEMGVNLPKNRINIKDEIRKVYLKLKEIFAEKEEKVAFSKFVGQDSKDRVATFIPLLHLDQQHKVWLEQEGHFDEIWILLKSAYEKQNKEILEIMRKEAASAMQELSEEEKQRAEKIESEFESPLAENVNSDSEDDF